MREKSSRIQRWDVDCVVNEHAVVGECPLWLSESSTLAWVDIPNGHVWETDPLNRTSNCYSIGQPVGSIARCSDGSFVLASCGELIFIETMNGPIVRRRAVPECVGLKFNDGKVDQHGRLWVGTACSGGMVSGASLFCIDDGEAALSVVDGVTMSNGLGWSPGGEYFYFVDTPTSGVDRFVCDYDHPMLSERRRHIMVAKEQGIPDGLSVDTEGNIWLAIWGGSAVYKYSPQGTLIGEVRVPAENVTSCTFGGEDLSTLYITTAAPSAFRSKRGNLDGAIFACKTGARGLPGNRFELQSRVPKGRLEPGKV